MGSTSGRWPRLPFTRPRPRRPALLLPPAAQAWPAAIVESLARDARRLVPRSLAQLMADREKEIFEASRAMPPELGLALATDFNAGQLRPSTVSLLEANATEA